MVGFMSSRRYYLCQKEIPEVGSNCLSSRDCIEKAEASKVKEFVSRLAKGDLKKELDDVLEILGYKQRSVLSPSLSLAEIDKEHFFKKFSDLKPPKI